MAKFTDNHETFSFMKDLEYWRNLVANCNDECSDNEFFRLAAMNFDHGSAVELITAAYTAAELEDMKNAMVRTRRLDLSDSLADILSVLWNYGERSRRKCKEVLFAMIDFMREDCPKPENDMLAARFDCLRRTLKLNDIESDILTLAYVKAETCFEWPHRIGIHQVPRFYAMALDRSIDEVREAMAPQGRLMKFSLLDDDFDFSLRTLGGFMDGSSDESVRRRFDYSMRFDRLSSAQREAVWRNQVARHGLEALVPREKIGEYACKYETSAGGISTVLANVRRMAPAPEEVDSLVETLMKPHCELLELKTRATSSPPGTIRSMASPSRGRSSSTGLKGPRGTSSTRASMRTPRTARG